ncbi:Arsenate reductase [Winogradskyella psychrotolerans RS-3]|uniref:Arsenate reductase n=1 Tax=Winogradskyella psychrotolerans RS-3 TaxID=641526 RepID=S7X3Q6_9FLAO|nr:arsenate reductase (glutaredoxin) [Winogradskyella psychrotolerans]EPR73659.1 Arsenate reductase [Winogradskyella psychrotolerans RS-3]
MIEIYHNPRCSKSRQGLSILEESGKAFEIIKYLEEDLTSVELQDVIIKLGIKPIDLIRKNEAIWKSEFKGKSLSDNEIIAAMVNHPKLIERPIVINGDKAVIGRPPEAIKEII